VCVSRIPSFVLMSCAVVHVRKMETRVGSHKGVLRLLLSRVRVRRAHARRTHGRRHALCSRPHHRRVPYRLWSCFSHCFDVVVVDVVHFDASKRRSRGVVLALALPPLLPPTAQTLLRNAEKQTRRDQCRGLTLRFLPTPHTTSQSLRLDRLPRTPQSRFSQA